MPICILGMHRSGTSMIARLLNLCGVYLGREDVLNPPLSADNPEGYWEHMLFVNLNEEILASFGGSWNHPPVLEPGWSQQAPLKLLAFRAKGVAAELEIFPYWGWKDPRNCLTLEFWLNIYPDLKLVFCLRNPCEVAASLGTGKAVFRNLKYEAALALWEDYHKQVLIAVPSDRLIVTHYETFFYDPQAELRRLADLLDIPVTDDTIAQAVSSIQKKQKHQIAPEPIFTLTTGSVEQFYKAFCTLAGPIYQAMVTDVPYKLAMEQATARSLFLNVKTLEKQKAAVEEASVAQQAEITALQLKFDATELNLAAATRSNQELEQAQIQKEAQKRELQSRLNATELNLAAATRSNQELEQAQTQKEAEANELQSLLNAAELNLAAATRSNQELEQVQAQKEAEARELRSLLNANQLNLAAATRSNQELEQVQAQKEAEVRELRRTYDQTIYVKKDIEQQAARLQSEIVRMRRTRGWRTLEAWWNLKKGILPSHEARWHFRQLRHTFWGILKRGGPIALLNRTVRWLRGERRYYHNNSPVIVDEVEGRIAKMPIGNAKIRILRMLQPLDTELVLQSNPVTLSSNSEINLAATITQNLPQNRFVICLSHDNYVKSVGGSQLVINNEQLCLNEKGIGYVHIFPTQHRSILLTTGEPISVSINCNGMFIGEFIGEKLLSALLVLKQAESGKQLTDIIIHHLLGFDIYWVYTLLNEIGNKKAFFWLHDYFTLCPNHVLLRNKIVFCDAPEIISNACTICIYGEARRQQSGFIAQLFSDFSITVLSPSQYAMEYWRKKSNLPTRAQLVVPNGRIDFITAKGLALNREFVEAKPIKIAFLGYPVYHKGWETWKELVHRFYDDTRYRFVHLGLGTDPTLNQEFVRVAVDGTHKMAMVDALKSNKVDVAFLWSVWPETLSFTMLEAISAGCYIVTHKDSGNIQYTVNQLHCGKSLSGDDDVFNFFSSGSLIDALADYHRNGALSGQLQHLAPMDDLIQNESN